MKPIHTMMLLAIPTTLLIGLLVATPAGATLAVIVNADNKGVTLSDKQIARIFLSKAKRLPNGRKIVPIDQDIGEHPRQLFTQNILRKSESQLKAYWSRLIFTGNGLPPKASGNDQKIITMVANNPDLIGYVDDNSLSTKGSVRVVYKL